MTNTMVLERQNKLIMPSNYEELNKEEMTYVEGGASYCYGTFASSDNAGAIWLASEANGWLIASGVWVADVILYSAAAAATSITGIGAVIGGVIAGLSGIVAGYSLSMMQSAVNAMEDAKYYQSKGKRYSIYINSFLGIVTGYSCREG